MTLRITTWANSDHTKKVVKTAKGFNNFFSIHGITDESTNVDTESAQNYIDRHGLKYVDTITVEFTITL